MRKVSGIFMLALSAALPAASQTGATAPTGNGLYVGPSSVAYADVDNAAAQIVSAVDGARTIVLYDRPTFSTIPYYQGV